MGALYYIFIYPLYIIIESIFVLAGSLKHPIFSIFMVSIVVSLLCLPFYLQADRYYEKDIEIKKKLEPKIKSIKANFKGDERFLILNEFYKRNRYSPFNQLKTIFGLIIQILVFISAYKFFTDITVDETQSVWFIKDILKPDNAIVINNIKINVLPIIMTIINIISAEVYLKIIKSNKRLYSYLIPVTFLILLYNSPSILVIYWIFNNIFSLIKNVIMLYIRRSKKDSDEKIEEEKAVPKQLTLIMILSCLSFMLLYSVFIPFQVFQDIEKFEKQYYIKYILECICTCFGMFFLFPIFYYLNSKAKNRMIIVSMIVSLLLSAIINFLFTNKDIFSVDEEFSLILEEFVLGNLLINISLILLFIISLFIFYMLLKKKYIKIILNIVLIIFISIFSITLYGLFHIDIISRNRISFEIGDTNIYKNTAKISLSKTNRNVILIFLDSASAAAMNLMLKYNPEVFNEFDGFTFYSDIKSLAASTKYSLQSAIGGWEYTPDKTEDHNYNILELQSLFMLPVIFSNLGYNINFFDNAKEVGDIEDYSYVYRNDLFKSNINILLNTFKNNKINVVVPKFNSLNRFIKDNPNIDYEYANTKKSIFYSIFLTILPYIKNILYNGGEYLSYKRTEESELIQDISKLSYLDKLTDFNSSKNTYTVLFSNLPHANLYNIDLYKENIFVKKQFENNYKYKSFIFSIYLINKYLKYLKENNVYDNTKIIIFSDHGSRDDTILTLKNDEKYPLHNDAIILYKDFNQKGELTIDNSDLLLPVLPSFVLQGIVDEPINTFTGEFIKNKSAQERSLYPVCSINSCYYNVHNIIRSEKIGDKCIECKVYRENTQFVNDFIKF